MSITTKVVMACDNCKRPAVDSYSSQDAAMNAAVKAGWRVGVPDGYGLADYCSRCAAEVKKAEG